MSAFAPIVVPAVAGGNYRNAFHRVIHMSRPGGLKGPINVSYTFGFYDDQGNEAPPTHDKSGSIQYSLAVIAGKPGVPGGMQAILDATIADAILAGVLQAAP